MIGEQTILSINSPSWDPMPLPGQPVTVSPSGRLPRPSAGWTSEGLLAVCRKNSAPVGRAYWAFLKTFSLNSLSLYFSFSAGDSTKIYPDMSLIDGEPLKWLFIRLCGYFIVFNCVSIWVHYLCILKSLLDLPDQGSPRRLTSQNLWFLPFKLRTGSRWYIFNSNFRSIIFSAWIILLSSSIKDIDEPEHTVSQLTASPSESQALLLLPATALSLFALDEASSECTNAIHLSFLFSSCCTYSLSWFNN